MKKLFSIILTLVLLITCTACSVQNKNGSATAPDKAKQTEKFTKSFLDLFDTASTIIAYDESQEKFDEHYALFYDKLEYYDHLFDIYNSYEGMNNINTINKKAAKEPVKVDSDIIELLEYSKEIYELSDGLTNICFGPVLLYWHNERELAGERGNGKLPNMDDMKEASKHTNIDDLIIDNDKSTVFFNDPLMRLDVGAIAKGFAVQKVVDYAQENLWTSAAVSIGGNVATYGFKENDDKTKWTIGIENPDSKADDYLLLVSVTGVSVVTSGDYQRYFTVDGKKYCHIINPQTLMPSEYMSSVSIICDDSKLGDALSTTLFNMPIEDGIKLVDSMDGVEAVWADKEFKTYFSSGFEKYIKE